jgi:hypothetical protein
VKAAPATNRLVRVGLDGMVTPLTTAHPDTQWAEPRWSPRGDRIAAVRWTRGGYGDIVLLDTTGTLVARITEDRAVDASPAWSADGRWLFFASDRTGVNQIYAAPVEYLSLANGAPDSLVRRVSTAATGLFEPEPSPDGERLAAVHYRHDGLHIGVAPLDTIGIDRPGVDPRFANTPVPRLEPDDARSSRYAPWRGLLPRYWLPTIGESSRGNTTLGGFTSGGDVVGRHVWQAALDWSPDDDEVSGNAAWAYRGLGLPVVTLVGAQSWDSFRVIDQNDVRVGTLLERTRELSVGFTLPRPRVRSIASLTVGGEYEWVRYTTDPEPLIDEISLFTGRAPEFRGAFVSLGWANASRPPLAISPEDGIQASAYGRQRWVTGESRPWSKEVVGLFSAFKSLPLPGYAHHVLAARVAAGWSEGLAPEVYGVGGESGASIEILPGIRTGTRRTFGVRGWEPDSREGRRALATSLEYRFPLSLAERGWGPLFFDRMSGAIYADAGAGWNPTPVAWIASAGAEIAFDIAWIYDDLYRLRLGAARPIAGASRSNGKVYVLLGSSF